MNQNATSLLRYLSAVALPALLLAGCATSDPSTTESEEEVGSDHEALTAEQCAYFDVNGKNQICHHTSSVNKPYTIIKTNEAGCISGHAGHDGDYITSTDPNSPTYDPTCSGGGCLPSGAPCDATLSSRRVLVQQRHLRLRPRLDRRSLRDQHRRVRGEPLPERRLPRRGSTATPASASRAGRGRTARSTSTSARRTPARTAPASTGSTATPAAMRAWLDGDELRDRDRRVRGEPLPERRLPRSTATPASAAGWRPPTLPTVPAQPINMAVDAQLRDAPTTRAPRRPARTMASAWRTGALTPASASSAWADRTARSPGTSAKASPARTATPPRADMRLCPQASAAPSVSIRTACQPGEVFENGASGAPLPPRPAWTASLRLPMEPIFDLTVSANNGNPLFGYLTDPAGLPAFFDNLLTPNQSGAAAGYDPSDTDNQAGACYLVSRPSGAFAASNVNVGKVPCASPTSRRPTPPPRPCPTSPRPSPSSARASPVWPPRSAAASPGSPGNEPRAPLDHERRGVRRSGPRPCGVHLHAPRRPAQRAPLRRLLPRRDLAPRRAPRPARGGRRASGHRAQAVLHRG